MSKLIDVDKIEWGKGVFVNPNTEEPLPIIHKIATIEMLRDFQEEVKAIPLDKVKEAREKIWRNVYEYSGTGDEVLEAYKRGFQDSLKILDKLIESEG